MDYQCIVVYTIVRINPLQQLTAEHLVKERRNGCFHWIKNQIKRFEEIIVNLKKWKKNRTK